MIVDAAI